MRSLGILIICLVVLCASMASAALPPQDKLEMSFSGGWAKLGNSSGDISATYLIGNAGKMVTPNIQVQASVLYANLSGMANIWAIAPAGVYYFNTKSTMDFTPYVGVGFYTGRASSGGGGESRTGFHYLLGAKSFLGQDPATAQKAVFLEYRFFNNIISDIDGSSIMVGITNYF